MIFPFSPASLLAVENFRLFLDPLPLWQDTRWPWLLVPLCLVVSVVYKCIRCKSMKSVPKEAGILTVVIIVCMVAASVALAVLVRGLER